MYRNGIKRLLAVVLSLCGMICLSWLFLILAVAIKLDSPGPVFFKQKRVGIGKKHFYILKFRTMRIDTPHDMPTHLLHDPDQYITRMGHFLRKTSLDELPQLWNIFVGDMAVIGPRPALWNQYDLLAERDKYHANDVRPGLTGWAQIHGRDELEIAEKAKLDGWYVEHLSFGLDVKCFFGTIAAVLKHDGVVEGGTGTLHEDRQSGTIKNRLRVAAARISSAEKDFMFAVLENLRIFQNCFFTEGVVNRNCILPRELEIAISLDLSPEKRIIKQYTRRQRRIPVLWNAPISTRLKRPSAARSRCRALSRTCATASIWPLSC